MEELIKQDFLKVNIIGPLVLEGHYDLVGPNGEIILPQVWESVIEPDWSISMHMWPMEPKEQKDLEPLPPSKILSGSLFKPARGARVPHPRPPSEPSN